MDEKKMLSTELYDCTYGEEWEVLEKIKDREKDNYIKFRLEEVRYHCGCFHHCECRREKLVLVGKRLENDVEFATRLQKEKNDKLDRELREKAYKKAEYERLKKEFES